MLTGRRLFEGETVSDVLAAVLTQRADWAALPAATPGAAAPPARALPRARPEAAAARHRRGADRPRRPDARIPRSRRAAPAARRSNRVSVALALALALATIGSGVGLPHSPAPGQPARHRDPPADARPYREGPRPHRRHARLLHRVRGRQLRRHEPAAAGVRSRAAIPCRSRHPWRRPYIHDILPRRNELLVEDDVRGSFLPARSGCCRRRAAARARSARSRPPPPRGLPTGSRSCTPTARTSSSREPTARGRGAC